MTGWGHPYIRMSPVFIPPQKIFSHDRYLTVLLSVLYGERETTRTRSGHRFMKLQKIFSESRYLTTLLCVLYGERKGD